MYTTFLNEVLTDASAIANKNFGGVGSSIKSGDNNQVLTQADLEIGQFIIKQLRRSFKDYNIIDEEAGVIDNNSEFTWVVDPIDGTSNFASGLPHYGIMIGLLKGNIPIAGGIVLPYFEQLYLAEKDGGCFCGDKQILISNEENIINSLIVYQIDGHQERPELTKDECSLLADIILSIRNLRTSGSAFDLAMVASGKYGAILNKTSKIWDNVAQQIIIEEAGGIYTDFSGKSIDYSHPLDKVRDNFTYVAGSRLLHKRLMSIINK